MKKVALLLVTVTAVLASVGLSGCATGQAASGVPRADACSLARVEQTAAQERTSARANPPIAAAAQGAQIAACLSGLARTDGGVW